ncbi:MAG: dihydrofolate reductase [Treponema sp.]|nr:dihydrofolate reductase [Treponema sp.]
MIAIIAAYTKNRALGKNGTLPYHLPNDLAHFKKLTINNIVIMGRKTFESIEKPLPFRIMIVISHTRIFYGKNVCTVRTFEEALERAQVIARSTRIQHCVFFRRKHIFIAGGAEIYAKAIPLCNKMFITEIDAECDGDTFFPQFDASQFTKKNGKKITTECVPYTFVTYKRI